MARSKTSRSAFGNALDKILDEKALLQTDFAAALNVSPAYVNRMLTGGTSITANTVNKVASAIALDGAAVSQLMSVAAASNGYAPAKCPHCGKPLV